MANKLFVTLGVAAGILLLDQITKTLAVAALEGKPAVEVVGSLLRLYLVRNPGAAFSLAGGYTIFISVLAIGVTFFIVRTARTLTSMWWAVVLGGILGGALGNLMDRLFRSPGPFRGHVVDFLQLPNWPVFNVADMALVGSAILAVVLSIVGVDMGPAHPDDQAADERAPANAEFVGALSTTAEPDDGLLATAEPDDGLLANAEPDDGLLTTAEPEERLRADAEPGEVRPDA